MARILKDPFHPLQWFLNLVRENPQDPKSKKQIMLFKDLAKSKI